MSDLIKGFIYVKDPLSLFAFLALILLVAFRTKRVPELLFSLLKKTVDTPTLEKLTRRFMAYAFAAFVVVCGCAVTGQVLAHATGAHPSSVDDAKQEIAASTASDEQKQAALNTYADALVAEQNHKLDEAIQSLQASIAQVPSLSAEYTLALLYQRKHDDANASSHAEAAAKLVKPGDTLAQIRVQRLEDNLRTERFRPAQQNCDFVDGRPTPFPPGGSNFGDATTISSGFYVLNDEVKQISYFKVMMKANQQLKIDYRTVDSAYAALWLSVYDSRSNAVTGAGEARASTIGSVEWTNQEGGRAFFSLKPGTSVGSLVCVAVKD